MKLQQINSTQSKTKQTSFAGLTNSINSDSIKKAVEYAFRENSLAKTISERSDVDIVENFGNRISVRMKLEASETRGSCYTHGDVMLKFFERSKTLGTRIEEKVKDLYLRQILDK